MIHPLTLAYIGDAAFSLFVREQLLKRGCEKVRIMHEFSRTIVSAKLQAYAVRQLLPDFGDAEQSIYLRGRNTNSPVPKSATVAEYRAATGFETLLGYLRLSGEEDRLYQLMLSAFDLIYVKIAGSD